MARQEALRLNIRIEGVRETLAGFRGLGREASAELRTKTLELSETLAGRVRAAASSQGSQAALMGPTVKARKDRVPSIQAGGSKRVGRNRKPAHKLLFGSEFGATELKQYRPHLGKGSYWFYITVERNEAEIADAWKTLADDVATRFRNARAAGGT
ncbi:MAG: hypothetical protein L0I24_00220 [Pseudonocardia sp.]|nr:hypothetical protein [Pseudonocardia sp.]